MKQVIIAVVCIGATTGAVAAAAVPRHAGTSGVIGAATVQPYHQESSIRVVRTAQGYRIVAQSSESRRASAVRVK